MKNGATSEQIEAFKQQCEEADVSTVIKFIKFAR